MTPTPTMTSASRPDSVCASARMPASLRAPRTVPAGAMTRSFGHLIMTGSPDAACRASAMAMPVASVSLWTQSAADPSRASRIADMYRPEPGGENHACPARPRPAVCCPAMTSVPSDAAPSARRKARSLVDEATGKYSTVEPSGSASPCAIAAARPSSSSRGSGDGRSISGTAMAAVRSRARCRPPAPSGSRRRRRRSRRRSPPARECGSA